MQYSDISYDEVGWKNYPSTSTKLNAENLNKMEQGIKKLVIAMTEIRTLLGSDDLIKNNVIAAVNELSGKFGGYEGYNLLDMGLLTEETNGFFVSGKLKDLGLAANASYTISMEADEDIYFYQYDSHGEMLSTEILSDGGTVALTISSKCESIKVFFPKSLGYTSKTVCIDAKVMLEVGIEKHDYEPYTGGEKMSDLWQEILENQNDIKICKKYVAGCQEFIQNFAGLLEGEY